MSNKKLRKGIIPPQVFELRNALVSDFFAVYESRLDEVEVLQLGDWEPDFPPTVEQMGKILGICISTWKGYITKYGLPRTLIPTLENTLKKEWEAKEVMAQAIPRHQRTRK